MLLVKVYKDTLELFSFSLKDNDTKKIPWTQNCSLPNIVEVTYKNEKKTFILKVGKKNTHSIFYTIGGEVSLAVNFTEGIDPRRPSLSGTIKTVSKKELASCFKCGAIYEEKLSLVKIESLCPVCEGGKDGH